MLVLHQRRPSRAAAADWPRWVSSRCERSHSGRIGSTSSITSLADLLVGISNSFPRRALSRDSLPPGTRARSSRRGRCSRSIGTAFTIDRNRSSPSIGIYGEFPRGVAVSRTGRRIGVTDVVYSRRWTAVTRGRSCCGRRVQASTGARRGDRLTTWHRASGPSRLRCCAYRTILGRSSRTTCSGGTWGR